MNKDVGVEDVNEKILNILIILYYNNVLCDDK